MVERVDGLGLFDCVGFSGVYWCWYNMWMFGVCGDVVDDFVWGVGLGWWIEGGLFKEC